MKKHEVWNIPTKLGSDSFGWVPKKLKEFEDKDMAEEFAYLEDCDEPAPDKHQYREIRVISRKA